MEQQTLSFWARHRIFQKVVAFAFFLYIGIMIGVAVIAYSRTKTGRTGMDMGQVQQMRYQANLEE